MTTSTTPTVEHAAWCERPPLRVSRDLFDRTRTRYRCPECGRQTHVTKPLKETTK
jgi:hypothetical protein